MKDLLAESEHRCYEYFKDSETTSKYKMKLHFQHFLRTELIAAYEKGRKDFAEEMVGKIQEMSKECPNHNPEDTVECYGYDEYYNSALSSVATLLRESVVEKLPEGQ